jgi:hypothetical protein
MTALFSQFKVDNKIGTPIRQFDLSVRFVTRLRQPQAAEMRYCPPKPLCRQPL